jgi:hypothetical protein
MINLEGTPTVIVKGLIINIINRQTMDDVQRQFSRLYYVRGRTYGPTFHVIYIREKNVCLAWEEMASIRYNETLFSNIIHINKLC